MATEVTLSKRAEKMLERLRNPENFFLWEKYRNSPVMEELAKAGYVGQMGRVASTVACYVPRGATPFELEEFPGFRRYQKLTEQELLDVLEKCPVKSGQTYRHHSGDEYYVFCKEIDCKTNNVRVAYKKVGGTVRFVRPAKDFVAPRFVLQSE